MTREEQRELRREKLQEKKREEYYGNDYIMPPECDACCRFRDCYNKYENRGSFTPGRGYTSYHSDFRPACGTRLSHGCPSRRGEPDDSFDLLAALEWALAEFEKSQNPDIRPRARRVAFAQARRTLRDMIKWQKKRNEHEAKGARNE